MTKASDNIFPKLTLVEGSAPASPAASDFSLYFDSADHLLKWKNSAGTVTTLATGTAMTNPMTTAGDIILGDTGGAAIRLAKGTDSQVLTVDPTTHLPLWAAGGGGGGLAQSFVGYNTIGGTWTAVTSTRQINKKITLASAATLTSIDAHVRANSDGFQVMMVGLLTDNAGAPDLLCAVNYAGNMLLSNSSSGFPHAGRWVSVPLGIHVPAGDYWLAWFATGTQWDIANDGSGNDRYWLTTSAAGITGAHSGVGSTTGTINYSIRASILS